MSDRPESRDIAYLLSSGVSAGLIVFILGALGTLFYVNARSASQVAGAPDVVSSESEDATPPGEEARDAGRDRGATGGSVGAPGDGPGATAGADGAEVGGQGPDGDQPGSIVGPSEGTTDRPTPPSPSEVDGDAGVRPELPDRDGGPGLFSADDPDRVVRITPNTRPVDERVVMVDLDGDGLRERVRAAVVANQVRTRLERMVGGTWVLVSQRAGAVADRLVSLRAMDLTRDGRPEILTKQWVGTQGESITLWAYADDQLRRMAVSGGCADGSNTIGLVGALAQVPGVERPTLAGVCRRPALEPHQWPSALYEWRDGRWVFSRYQGEIE